MDGGEEMARMLGNPSRTVQVPVSEIRSIAKRWRTHATAATKGGSTLIADIWNSAADELDDAAKKARERWCRTNHAAQHVKDMAAARQLAAQAQKLRNESERLDKLSRDCVESGSRIAAEEHTKASALAMKQADRAEYALQIICEVRGIDPSEI